MQSGVRPRDDGRDAMQPSAVPIASLAASSMPVLSPMAARKQQVAQSPEAFLSKWLSWFKYSTTQWGLITDVRADGSTFQRHGIVVKLFVNLKEALARAPRSDEFYYEEDEEDDDDDDDEQMFLWQLRYAVDLVKLTLAVNPLAAKRLLLRRSERMQISSENGAEDANISENELKQLARGDAPFEVRLQIDIEENHLHLVQRRFVDEFMGGMDEEVLDVSEEEARDEDALRSNLMDHVQQSSAARRLSLVPVRTVLRVSSYIRAAADGSGSNSPFFDHIAPLSDDLRAYQDQRDTTWDIATRFAPLVVERIDLRLGDIPLTTSALQNITAIVERGIPIVCSTVWLEVRSIDCEEGDLQAFLNALTASGEPINIDTGRVLMTHNRGDDAEDISSKITMLLRCIGRLNCEVSVNLSGFFSASWKKVNRQAMVHGLVQFILSCEAPAISVAIDDAQFSDEDIVEIRQTASRWKNEHPGEKLRLRSLDLRPEMDCLDCVSALVAVLDDVEEFTLSCCDEFTSIEDLHTVFHFPGLRRLSIRNASIPSINVFDSSSGSFPPLQLEKLDLSGLTLADSASMVAFVKSLDPRSIEASSLSQTLQCLSIAETDGTVFWENAEDYDDIRLPLVRLAINDPAAVAALDDVLAFNETLRYVNFVGDFENSLPVAPVCDDDYSAETSFIVARPLPHRVPLEKARKAAFLSAIQQGSCSASRDLDSNLISAVLEFDALRVVREVRI